jgi:ectoine hydroxylase-related dioxygenase (phytanoyl-CoA dioxygenase family)
MRPASDPWTIKAGMIHVEPRFTLIERMVTIRVHLDAVPRDNGPLLIAPASHRLGKIAEADLAAVVERCGVEACLADPGDLWAYATPIVHASAASTHIGHRRVFQIDYSADPLPDGLEWLGI